MAMEGHQSRIGVDVGGTFTDVVRIDDGEVSVTKVPSTPAAPEQGVQEALDATSQTGLPIGFIAHGTTVATNAVLEGTWARTALITTRGFRDVLEIGRQARPSLYDLHDDKPEPIVPRNRRFEVDERLDERGNIETALTDSALTETVTAIEEADVDAVGICLLFAYERDDHERMMVDALSGLDIAISRSSDVLPEIREYERTLATVLNAALKPVMARYLDRLVEVVGQHAPDADLRIMRSNGGIIGPRTAAERPITTVLSGPAAGVTGAAYIAQRAGHEQVITMDMGGTSCDVSLVEGGEPAVSTEVRVGEYPIGLPMVDVHTIGAGGGSIAWIDTGGALRVGPRSAGADPGPVCYGRGGTDATVTDAHAVLGRIDPTMFPSDALSPSIDRAERHLAAEIASPLELPLETAAAGIIEIADANMERAIRVVSIERGHDPRSFALVAFGGAGPLHASTIARSLEIPTVLVPRAAGVLSALGLVLADVVHEFSTSKVRLLDTVDPADLDDRFETFASEGRERLTDEDIDDTALTIERSIEMRYLGQSYTIPVSVPAVLDEAAMETVADRFHEHHRNRYGYASPGEPLELVTLRLRAIGHVRPPDLKLRPTDVDDPTPDRHRQVWFDNAYRETAIFDRSTLQPGMEFEGPAVVEGPDSTALIHPNQHGSIDPYGTIVIDCEVDR